MGMPEDTADALVIGAGHNGLVAANMLADAGWDVLVLEAGGTPGGAVRSAELAAPGYVSDLCSAFFPFAGASPPLRALCLDEWGLRWRHAPDVLAHLLPDGRAAVLNRDPDRTAGSMEEFAPGDGRRWLDAYAEWRRISARLLDTVFTPFPPVRPGAALLRDLRPGGILRLARRFLTPVRQLSGELFDGDGPALLFAGCALHTDLSPDDVGSGLYGWLLSMVGQEYGFPVPVGGAQRISDALVARLRSRGGRIEYGERIDRVLVARNIAVGVAAAGGRRWRARRAVLADVPAPALFLDLVGAGRLPPRLVEDLAHFRWEGSTVKVDWALSAPVPWKTPAVAGAGTVHVGGDLNGLRRYATALACGEMPADPFIVTGQMTTADPARSPEGTESLWAYTHLPHRADWHPDQIREHARRLEAVLEDRAPGFGRLVVGRNVAGPAELEQENPSMVNGAINGGTSAAYQQLFLRPVPGLGRADTPVDRLFLASSSAHPGGGVHGGPGANAARAALARGRAATGPLYAAVVGAVQRILRR
jgi:phytoene dehydrogenase-like protein